MLGFLKDLLRIRPAPSSSVPRAKKRAKLKAKRKAKTRRATPKGASAHLRKLRNEGKTGYRGKVFSENPAAEADAYVKRVRSLFGRVPSAAEVEGYTGARPGYWRGKTVAGVVLK